MRKRILLVVLVLALMAISSAVSVAAVLGTGTGYQDVALTESRAEYYREALDIDERYPLETLQDVVDYLAVEESDTQIHTVVYEKE